MFATLHVNVPPEMFLAMLTRALCKVDPHAEVRACDLAQVHDRQQQLGEEVSHSERRRWPPHPRHPKLRRRREGV